MQSFAEMLKDASIYTVKQIVKIVEEHPEKINDLVKLTLSNKGSVSLRAAWTLAHCHEEMPYLVEPYVVDLLNACPNFTHAGARRSILKIMSTVTVPEDYKVFLFDHCLQWLISKKEPIAVKAYAMDILSNIALEEPDLKNEVIPAILDVMPNGSKGIRAKGKIMLKKLGYG
jgi:hypothetical protein